MDKCDLALDFQLKSIEIREFLFSIVNKNHPDLAKIYSLLSLIYKKINNQLLSLEYEKKSLETN